MAVSFTALTLPVIVTKATSLYAPSVYNGTGTETKLNLVLSVTDAVRDEVAAIETQLNLGPNSCSVLKSGCLKVKIDMERVNVYDEDHQSIKPQVAQFACAEVEVRLELRGTWKTASSSGLSNPRWGLRGSIFIKRVDIQTSGAEVSFCFRLPLRKSRFGSFFHISIFIC